MIDCSALIYQPYSARKSFVIWSSNSLLQDLSSSSMQLHVEGAFQFPCQISFIWACWGYHVATFRQLCPPFHAACHSCYPVCPEILTIVSWSGLLTKVFQYFFFLVIKNIFAGLLPTLGEQSLMSYYQILILLDVCVPLSLFVFYSGLFCGMFSYII